MPFDRLKRREFITLLGGAAVWPLGAHAQRREPIRRIAVLLGAAESDLEAQASVLALENGLQELGWTKKRNIEIVYRWAAGDASRMRAYAAEFASLKPDVIFCVSTPGSRGSARGDTRHPDRVRKCQQSYR
jgi:putative tryptophan/tyrosine transport system substrate-binding protein